VAAQLQTPFTEPHTIPLLDSLLPLGPRLQDVAGLHGDAIAAGDALRQLPEGLAQLHELGFLVEVPA
jgi:hypothetical protein